MTLNATIIILAILVAWWAITQDRRIRADHTHPLHTPDGQIIGHGTMRCTYRSPIDTAQCTLPAGHDHFHEIGVVP